MLHPTGAIARQSLIFDNNRAPKSTEKTLLAPGHEQSLWFKKAPVFTWSFLMTSRRRGRILTLDIMSNPSYLYNIWLITICYSRLHYKAFRPLPRLDLKPMLNKSRSNEKGSCQFVKTRPFSSSAFIKYPRYTIFQQINQKDIPKLRL